MALLTCMNCGVTFLTLSKEAPYCTECSKLEDKPLDRVKNYILYHPGCNLMEVVNATGIDCSIMLKFLDRGAIVVSNPKSR